MGMVKEIKNVYNVKTDIINNKKQEPKILVAKNLLDVRAWCGTEIDAEQFSKVFCSVKSYLTGYYSALDRYSICLVDPNTKQLLSYANYSVNKHSKCVNIDFINTPNNQDKNKGYASTMLNYIQNFAQEKGCETIELICVNEEAKYLYSKHGYVVKENNQEIMVPMVKMVNSENWKCSVIFNEALKLAKANNVRIGDAMLDIIKHKKYDSMFEYGVIEENEYGNNKNVSHAQNKRKYKAFDKYVRNLYNDDPIVPMLMVVLDEAIIRKDDTYVKTLDNLIAEKRSDVLCENEAQLKNIIRGINNLQKAESFDAISTDVGWIRMTDYSDLNRSKAYLCNEDYKYVKQNYSYFWGTTSKKPQLYILYDKNSGKLLSHISVHNGENDGLYITEVGTDHNNRNKGYAGFLLDKVCENALEDGYNKAYLYASSFLGESLYSKKGFVQREDDYGLVSMCKMLEPHDWACSVVYNTAINYANAHNMHVGDALKEIIDKKEYDTMFEYGVIHEQEFGANKTDAKTTFDKWDAMVTNLYENDPITPIIINILEKKRNDKNHEYTTLEDEYIKVAADCKSLEMNDMITLNYNSAKNIFEGIRLLRRSENYYRKQKKLRCTSDKTGYASRDILQLLEDDPIKKDENKDNSHSQTRFM